MRTRWRQVSAGLAALGLVGSLLTAGDTEAAFPGGNGQIAFTRVSDGQAHIYLVNGDGSGLRALGGEPRNARKGPGWSSDGARIAFIETNEREAHAVVSAAADGSERRLVSRSTALTSGPVAWSPDGRELAFSRATPNGPQVFVAAADGSGARRLTNFVFRFPTEPAWSPDGTLLAFSDVYDKRAQLYLVRPDGSGLRRLPGAHGGQPDWSPDGTELAFAASRAIFAIDADGTRLRRLTDGRGGDRDPVWSPDGSRIAFASARAGGQIFVMNADGRCETQLTRTAGDSADEPAWQPLPGLGRPPEPLRCADPSIRLTRVENVTPVRDRPVQAREQRYAYRFVVRNEGNEPAPSVAFRDDVSSHARVVSAVSTRGDCDGMRIVECELGDLESGARVEVLVVAQATAPGKLSNSAAVTGGGNDPNSWNNRDRASVRICSYTGTPRPDIIVASPQNDLVCARRGNDVIRGGGGRDRLEAGLGHDVITGGPGDDWIEAGSGRDRVEAGRGSDFIITLDGRRDVVHGGRGMDSAWADKVDRLVGVERATFGVPD